MARSTTEDIQDLRQGSGDAEVVGRSTDQTVLRQGVEILSRYRRKHSPVRTVGGQGWPDWKAT